MVFYSPIFLFLFLPTAILFYYILPHRFKNPILLLFSFLFYMWGQGYYAFVLLFIIVANYLLSLSIKSYPNNKIPLLAFAIALNVGILAVFKYSNFIIGNINSLFGSHIGFVDFKMPLGISFITFMAIAYLVDVYRGNSSPSKNPFNLAFYLSFFPKVTSGPLDRYNDIERQLPNRKVNVEQVASGIKRFVIGLGKKILIANTLGVVANQIFAFPVGDLPTAIAWLGILCFTLQLYFDFSGYTDMAIGIGRMFGFELLENFNYPYISTSIREFWRRWHITLSKWLRDYLYIPLGGNRGTMLRTCLNLMAVFFICGLWHGANWTFVVWGLWHGSFLVLERMKWLRFKVISPVKHIYALLVIMVGWVFFRADSIIHALGYIKSMFGFELGTTAYDASIYLSPVIVIVLIVAIIGSLPVIPWLSRLKQRLASRWSFIDACYSVALVSSLLGIFVLSVIEIASGYYQPFLYGQF